MKFLVLMAEDDAFDRWDAATDEEREALRHQLSAFAAAVQDRGRVVVGEALRRPEEARTLRPGDGRVEERPVTQGPFAETAEQLGGFYLVDLPGLDDAVDIARLLPSGWTVEVRPIEPSE
jgi:hypothetical protein